MPLVVTRQHEVAGELMSKRTTSDKPAPRRRTPEPSAEAPVATPKPRTRRKASASADVTGADDRPLVQDNVITRPQPSHDDIAMRAYFIALEHGFQTDPTSAWLRAERELSEV
jgi:hypothetical protein